MSLPLERIAGTDWYFDGQVFDLPALSAAVADAPPKPIAGATLFLTVKQSAANPDPGALGLSYVVPASAAADIGLFRLLAPAAATAAVPAGRYEVEILLRTAGAAELFPVCRRSLDVLARLRSTLT